MNKIKYILEKITFKKSIYIIFFTCILCLFRQNVQATDTIKDSLGFDEYISTINKYVSQSDANDAIDITDLASNLISNKSIEYNSTFSKLLSIFFKEVITALKSGVSIYIVIILMAVISSLEIENDSSIAKISYLACFIVIAIINVKMFVDVIAIFKNTIGIISIIMKIVSPFLLTILIATGAISSTTIIQPMLLFLASLVNSIIEYIVIPFLSISVALNIIDSLTDKLRLSRLAKMFSKAGIWIIGVALTVFLGVLSLETNISSSVDSLAVKTTQAAVSDFIPVVGKFFSDSFETVVGATKIVSNVGGTIGIIAIIAVTFVPIIKILSIMLIYMILSALAEPICHDKRILDNLDMFAQTYKSLFGILVGVDIIFIISIAIILNLSSSILK